MKGLGLLYKWRGSGGSRQESCLVTKATCTITLSRNNARRRLHAPVKRNNSGNCTRSPQGVVSIDCGSTGTVCLSVYFEECLKTYPFFSQIVQLSFQGPLWGCGGTEHFNA